jgi:signal transduction histidine kinase
MKRLWPDSLLGRMLLVLAAGLVVSHAVGWWIYSSDRETALREIGGLALAQRIANVVRLVDDMPDDWRERILATASDQGFQVTLSPDKPNFTETDAPGPQVAAIQTYLIDALGLDAGRKPVIAGEAVERPFGRGRGLGWGRMTATDGERPANSAGAGHGRGRGGGRWRSTSGPEALVALTVGVPLASGQWVRIATSLPEVNSTVSNRFVISMLAMAAVILAVSIWAARRVTAPLAALASAAQRLGRNVDAPPVAETGTREMRQAAHAFNDMQARLRDTIGHRTRLLAAISHDLRTPLTSLRLRAETHPDADERGRMLATIDEMSALVGTTLQFARDETADEPVRPTDLVALVDSVVDDFSEAGKDVTVTPSVAIVIACRPTALKRALRNLIDNAIRYGQRAEVAVHDAGTDVDIFVDDDGPGLPPEELTRVFQPFYRIDNSRSREAGGVGLGLAITRSLVGRQGGAVTLENRPQGGLRARLRIPKATGGSSKVRVRAKSPFGSHSG